MTRSTSPTPAPTTSLRSSTTAARGSRAAWLMLLLLVAGCATTGSTSGSGVGDRMIAKPPFYAGQLAGAVAEGVAHLPITYQRGAEQSPIFEPAGTPGSPVAALLAEMNAYLDSLGVTTRVPATSPMPGTPPDVRFGCETDAAGDCIRNTDGALGRRPEYMRLAVGRPSADWIAWTSGALQGADRTHALVVTLEVGQFFVQQRGLRGDKVVELGTGHTVPLRWLTSLETPVSVVMITGALVDRDGRAVRMGAEGMLAKRTRLLASSFGAQALITDEDVNDLRAARRDDLPGQPLVWQVALREMVTQLTGAALASRQE
jgi:hypothetical protein